MNLSELCDPIEDAPVAKFDNPGDTFSGIIVKFERQNDKYVSEQIPVITLQLDKPTADGDEYAVVRARNTQMRRVIGRAAKRAGATDEAIGNWLSVTFVEERGPTAAARTSCTKPSTSWRARATTARLVPVN